LANTSPSRKPTAMRRYPDRHEGRGEAGRTGKAALAVPCPRAGRGGAGTKPWPSSPNIRPNRIVKEKATKGVRIDRTVQGGPRRRRRPARSRPRNGRGPGDGDLLSSLPDRLQLFGIVGCTATRPSAKRSRSATAASTRSAAIQPAGDRRCALSQSGFQASTAAAIR
jgi:hypothetical protein